jgi:hypothetical protein
VFERALLSGKAKLVIRPELREYFHWTPDAVGSTRAELLAPTSSLRDLAAFPMVEAALSDRAAGDWAASWDCERAAGSASNPNAWRDDVADPDRLVLFRQWLMARPVDTSRKYRPVC